MKELPEHLAAIISERQAEVLVVGVPLSADGRAGPQAKKVLALVAALEKRFPEVVVVTTDEAHSSDVAHMQLKDAGIRAAKRRQHVDSLAALEILRRFRGEL